MLDAEGVALDRLERPRRKILFGRWTILYQECKDLNLENAVFVDNTASESVAGVYEEVLKASIGVVASNKIAAADTQARYEGLKRIARAKNTQYRFETNVGAGLPVIDTIEHLVQSGDRIHRIDAVLSGTLNYLFSTFGPECGFVESCERGHGRRVHGARSAD